MKMPVNFLKNFWRIYYQKRLEHRSINFSPARKRFVRESRKFWSKYFGDSQTDDASIVLTEFTSSIFLGLGVAILGNIIAKAKNARVMYLNPNQSARSTWFLLGFQKQLFADYKPIIGQYQNEIDDDTNHLYSLLKTPSDILSIKYDGLLIGDLIYDQIQRSPKGWKATVWEIDSEVKKSIRNAIEIIYTLNHIISRYNVRASVFTHSVSIYGGGLPLRYLRFKGIESYCGRAGLRSIKKYQKGSDDDFWISPLMEPDEEIMKALLSSDLRTQAIIKARKYVKSRMTGSHKDTDSRKSFLKSKPVYSEKGMFCEKYGLDGDKQLVWVMLHAFNDFPHHFQNNLFDDYYRWFIHTLKLAQKNTDVNWIFKEHPSSVYFPDDANLEGLFEIENSNHILFLNKDADFNTSSLQYIADCILTCLGTAGVEFSSLGVPVVLGSENYYSKYGIGLLPESVEEYDKILMELGEKELKPVTQEQMDVASIILYLVLRFYTGHTPYNNRFIPYHDKDIALQGEELSFINFYLEEIANQDIYKFLSKVEKFVSSQERSSLIQISDIEKDLVVDSTIEIGKSVLAS